MSAGPQALLKALFDSALATIEPRLRLPGLLPTPSEDGRLVVVGAGKAAAAMALVTAEHYGAKASGVVVTREGYGLRPGESTGGIRVLESTHPAPSEASLRAAEALFDAVSKLTERDTVVCLISGGGSALLERPVAGLSLAGLRAITTALLASGAAIGEINVLRKHLSAIKGGRLAVAAWPARVETFAISDVPGDDPALIASGPTMADPSTCADALAIARRYAIALPEAVDAALRSGALETPNPADPKLARCGFRLIGTARDALDGAAHVGREHGYRVVDLGERIEGEAAMVAARHAGLAIEAGSAPTLLLSGGEVTVTHAGGGVGGPNREYALALTIALARQPHVWALAADTDGLDGAADATGAYVTPNTLSRAEALGLDAAAALRNHDSGPFFAALGDALVTGPTRTNVSDFRAILVNPR